MVDPEKIEKIAEWLYRYRSFTMKRNAWEELVAGDPPTAAAYRRDAQVFVAELSL